MRRRRRCAFCRLCSLRRLRRRVAPKTAPCGASNCCLPSRAAAAAEAEEAEAAEAEAAEAEAAAEAVAEEVAADFYKLGDALLETAGEEVTLPSYHPYSCWRPLGRRRALPP